MHKFHVLRGATYTQIFLYSVNLILCIHESEVHILYEPLLLLELIIDSIY